MRVDIVRPRELEGEADVAVVIDVFRATTTATVLLVARSVAGTTGRALRPADVLLMAAVGLPIVVRDAGPMKGGTAVIAFVEDPDGYKVEIVAERR